MDYFVEITFSFYKFEPHFIHKIFDPKCFENIVVPFITFYCIFCSNLLQNSYLLSIRSLIFKNPSMIPLLIKAEIFFVNENFYIISMTPSF